MINLYNALPEIPYSYADDPYARCLRFKIGATCKYFNIEMNYELLKQLDEKQYKKEQYFLISNKEVYFIPLEFVDGSIYALQMRAVKEKKFWNIKFQELPLLYGWMDLKDIEIGKPVILCEGLKDAQTIKLLYKYVLAYMTASPGEDVIEYLSKVSKKIIIIGDADKAGRSLKWKEYLKGIKKNFLGKKDAGYYWDTNSEVERTLLLKNIEIILKKEGVI